MRILTVRIGRAGDMVMITPALKALIECHPDAEFTLLTSPDGKRLLGNYHSQIKDIWVWNRSAIDSFLQKIRLKECIKNNHFDKIICFETRKNIVGLFHNAASELYWQDAPAKPIHSARSYLNLAEKACAKQFSDIYANLRVSPEAAERVKLELQQSGIQADDIVIALHPTYSGYSRFNLRKRGARKHKLWPAENFGQLARSLNTIRLNNGKTPKIIIDLLDDEVPLGEKIVEYSDNSIILLNARPNIERYKALLQRVDLLVTPDTGPMHIAAAVGTRIIALFSGKDPADCGPYMEPGLFTVLRAESTEKPDAGIAAIDVESVLTACNDQLNRTGS